jgi:lysophospholipase L1-like esterase
MKTTWPPFALLAWLVSCSLVTAEEVAPPAQLLLKPGGHVAIAGDSITEQKIYSKYIELYLAACLPQYELHCIQLGFGGEKAPGFRDRMTEHLMWYKPDVVTLCYGMNDGGYIPYADPIGKTYESAMGTIVGQLKKAGATVVIGGPGAVDSKFFNRGALTPALYNENLGRLAEIARKIAAENKFPFANLHDRMMDAMAKAKAARGEDFDVCGRDGVHPQADGHLVMAYAFLKAMGLDGNLACFTIDLQGAAAASEGHRILSGANGTVEIESTRYPFCFPGDEKSSGSPRSMLPFVAFQQELNRFLLVVKNLGTEKASVTWGKHSRSFSRAELEKGINLSEAFPENPFSANFARLEQLVGAKEAYETQMIKSALGLVLGMARSYDKDDKEAQDAIALLRGKLFVRYEKLHQDVRAAVVPVKHTIVVAPEK